jgi:hypothetical protein
LGALAFALDRMEYALVTYPLEPCACEAWVEGYPALPPMLVFRAGAIRRALEILYRYITHDVDVGTG